MLALDLDDRGGLVDPRHGARHDDAGEDHDERNGDDDFLAGVEYLPVVQEVDGALRGRRGGAGGAGLLALLGEAALLGDGGKGSVCHGVFRKGTPSGR